MLAMEEMNGKSLPGTSKGLKVCWNKILGIIIIRIGFTHFYFLVKIAYIAVVSFSYQLNKLIFTYSDLNTNIRGSIQRKNLFLKKIAYSDFS